MHFLSTYAIALSLAANFVLGSPVDLQPRQQTDRCASGVHVIVGCPRTYPARAGMLQSLIDGIQGNITGSDYYLIPYNDGSQPGKDASPVMIQAVKDYSVACPNTPIALIGYSLGGIVVMNTVCGGVPSTYLNNNLLAAIAYGEETYRGGQSYDAGTCRSNAPQYARSDPETCGTYAPIVKSWCNAEDSACCSTGNDINAHYTYATLYDQSSISWIWQQFQAWKKAKTPKPSSSVRSSTSSSTSRTSAAPTSKTTTSSSVRSSSSSSARVTSTSKPAATPTPSPTPKPQPTPTPTKSPWQQWLDWWHKKQSSWGWHH